jgi:hypothetical protein
MAMAAALNVPAGDNHARIILESAAALVAAQRRGGYLARSP